jgi:hypothetical protein
MAIDIAVRNELIRRSRDKRFRQSVSKSTEPCRWYPHRVLHPVLGIPFTEAGAWNFVAELLSCNHDVTTIAMEKPSGQIGYVLKTAGYKGCPEIYIKLTLSTQFVNGRSFHDDE